MMRFFFEMQSEKASLNSGSTQLQEVYITEYKRRVYQREWIQKTDYMRVLCQDVDAWETAWYLSDKHNKQPKKLMMSLARHEGQRPTNNAPNNN